MTHVCPPGYCDCEQSFQNGNDDVGCRLEYSDSSAICDKTRTGIAVNKLRTVLHDKTGSGTGSAVYSGAGTVHEKLTFIFNRLYARYAARARSITAELISYGQ